MLYCVIRAGESCYTHKLSNKEMLFNCIKKIASDKNAAYCFLAFLRRAKVGEVFNFAEGNARLLEF
ncbi:hypothetical protein [Butyrivibrio proteoclasticus]|uniref:hypothetical protein n=1 Tax=Butyrivibrio proteoclasticus TaxID=43305 RepID=UPI00047EBF31|nr:hypothetical protein [Butyrivibrio proteoclasticus]